MGAAMRQLGWQRTDNPIRFGTETARGYTKGDESDEIVAMSDPEYRNTISMQLGQPPNVKERRIIVDGAVAPEANDF